MLPLINNIYAPPPSQPALVATPVPDNNTLRVLPTSVAPPVSSAQTDPNASGNNQLLIPTASSAPAAASAAPAMAGTVTNLSPEVPLGAPATLLAQMMGQNLPPEVQNSLRGVLNEYEKIIINSYVKYKPSNASLPQAEPASTFNQMLKASAPAQEKPAPARSASVANTQTESTSSDTENVVIESASPASLPKPSYNALNAYSVAANRIPERAPVSKESVDEVKIASE